MNKLLFKVKSGLFVLIHNGVMSDFDPPQEGTPALADASGGEPILPNARPLADPARTPGTIAPENLLDQNLDETNVEDALRARVTISTLASMASLDVVIPGGGMLAGLYDTLFRSREMNDDFSISNLGGTLEEYFRFQRGEVDAEGRPIHADGDDDDDDFVDAMQAAQERKEREQQELEAWAETEHSYAGVEMTGEEWGRLGEALSANGVLHKWLVNQIKKDGKAKTDADAESLANKVALRVKMNSLPPDRWTDDMRALDQQMKSDPELKSTVDEYVRKASTEPIPSQGSQLTTDSATNHQRDISVSVGSDAIFSGATSAPEVSSAGDRVIPVAARADGASSDFPSAPDLVAHHQAALAATVPLDRPKPSLTVVASAPAIPPPGGSGLDV